MSDRIQRSVLVLKLAGMSPGFIQFFLRWNERSPSAPVLKQTCVALLILKGALAFTEWRATPGDDTEKP